MFRRNAPENFFSAVRGCPRLCARTNPWFRGQILGEKCAQEPTPGSAVKHCRFLDTGGGGVCQTCFRPSLCVFHLFRSGAGSAQGCEHGRSSRPKRTWCCSCRA